MIGVVSLILAAKLLFVPLDDRPVTAQLPQMLGQIAGSDVVEPPAALLGNYLHFGQPDRIIAWLNEEQPARQYVISSDMLVYGGLVASRVPGVTYQDAFARVREFATLKRRSPAAWIGAFGTVMRLAPTGVPAIGDATSFFGAYPGWQYLEDYANLHDPPTSEEEAQAQHVASLAGPSLLQAYLQTRNRNYGVDHLLIATAGAREVQTLVLGQDDAKPFGLHVKELHALETFAEAVAPANVAIEPGADELGMALVARALAAQAKWMPRVAVRYSTPTGASYQDPLEFAPIDVTVSSLIRLCGGTRVESRADLTLDVRLPQTGAALDDAFIDGMRADIGAKVPVAVADVSFEGSYEDQGAFAQRLLSDGVASHIDAYSSWNTSANTIGTALAESIAAGAGRRMHTYDALAHRTFTFLRFVDDVDFHVRVRPDLNAWLSAQGVADHTYLLPDVAARTSARNHDLLWNDAAATLGQLYPGYHLASMRVTLPWNRTFETRIDAAIAPNL